jgi:hypothetical protein
MGPSLPMRGASGAKALAALHFERPSRRRRKLVDGAPKEMIDPISLLETLPFCAAWTSVPARCLRR